MHTKPFRDLGGEQIAEQVFARRQAPASSSSSSGTIADDSVTNPKLADMAASTIKARKTASVGDPEDCTLSEVLDFIGSAAQGDILYRGASGWARLGAGTSGFFLKTQGTGANPAWAAAGAFGSPTTVTVAGSAATTISFTGLDLATAGEYWIRAILKNATGSSMYCYLEFNSDTTTGNYYCTQILSNSSTGSDNSPRAFTLEPSSNTEVWIRVTRNFDGRPTAHTVSRSNTVSSPSQRQFTIQRDNTANVTSIQLVSGTANAFDIGSFGIIRSFT
jgi:hypothetical protein